MMQDRLLPESETAELLGVSPRTVQRLARQGTLRRVKVGGSTRYRLSDVERIIRQGTGGSSNA